MEDVTSASAPGGDRRVITLSLLIATVSVLYWIWTRIRSEFSPKLPGPRQYFLGGIINLLEFTDIKKITSKLVSVSLQYGPVFRVNCGPVSIVVLNSPENIQKLCGSLDINHVTKSVFYESVKPTPYIDGLITSKGQKWKTRRKLLGRILEYKHLLKYYPILNDESKELCIGIKAQFGGGRDPKPIQDLLYTSSLVCVCDAAMGRGLLADRTTAEFASFINMTNRFMQISAIRVTKPWLSFNPIWNLHPLSREMAQIVKNSENALKEYINQYEERRKSLGGHPSSSENVKESQGENLLKDLIDGGLSFEEIVEEALTMIMAGFHTTGLTLQNALLMLALHPEHQELCRQEVDALFEDEELCPNGEITQTGLQHLKYLERCINEAQRILPVIFFMMRRIESPLQLEDKIELPVGTNVAMFAQAIHMNPVNYPEPEKFDPDRWLPDEVAKRNPYSFLPFSAGIRKCIGYKFAMMELLILSARILRHFKWSTTDKLEDITWMPYVTMKPEIPFNFMFEERMDYPIGNV